MDLNSSYKNRPTLLWVLVLIVVAVGAFYVVMGLITYMADLPSDLVKEISKVTEDYNVNVDSILDTVKVALASVYIILGVLTLIIAFLLYSGSNGGRVLLVIILIVSIVGNAFGVVIGDITSIIWMLVAIVCFLLVYQAPVRAYFIKK
jgi:hypothetical protein